MSEKGREMKDVNVLMLSNEELFARLYYLRTIKEKELGRPLTEKELKSFYVEEASKINSRF